MPLSEKFNSFENVILSISAPTMKTPTMLVIMYSAAGNYTEFLSQFSEFLSALVLKTDRVIIAS